MKQFVTALAAILCLILAANAVAQEQQPVFYGVVTHQIKPDKVEKHNDAMKDLAAAFTKHGFSYPYSGYSGDRFRWYLLCPMKSIGDLDQVFMEIGKMPEKAGREWQSIVEREHDSLESSSMGVYMARPDLSYVPENPRLQEGEGIYVRWNIIRLKLVDDDEKIYDILRKWAELYKRKGIRDGYWISISIIENDMPVMVVARHARDEADYYENRKRIDEQLGGENEALWKEVSQYVRSEEIINARYIKEHSYMGSER